MSARLTPPSLAERAASRARMRRQNADAGFRAKASAGWKAAYDGGHEPERRRQAMTERMADPERRAVALGALAASLHDPRAYYAREAGKVGLNVKLPRWVPPDLIRDFLDFARDFGEIDAAMRVRRLMMEARE